MTTSSVADDGQPQTKKSRVIPQAQAVPLALEPTLANEALRFHFYPSARQVPHLQDSIDHDAGHEPLFSHQTFEDEEILGYAGLQLDIAMPTDTFVPILLHSYKEKRSPANDYVALLRKEFPAGLAVNQEELSQAVEKAESLQDCLADPTLKQLGAGVTKDGTPVHILGGDNLTKAGQPLRNLHSRMHPLLRFYIDGASELVQDDDRMGILIAAKMDGETPVAVLGFLMYYRFWVCPNLERIRVAQIITIPCFRNQGVATLLLQTITKVADALEKVVDVTYEDPADGLQALRERLDLQRCAPVATVWDAARACVTAGCAANDACPAANAASTSSTARALSAEQATRLAESQAVVVALQPTSAAVDAIRALKISRHQVPVLWDCLLWAVALKERLCSQDRIVDLLQIRVIHRILLSVAESSKGSDQAVPDNKVFIDLEDDDEENGDGAGGGGILEQLEHKLAAQRRAKALCAAVSADATHETPPASEAAGSADRGESAAADAVGDQQEDALEGNGSGEGGAGLALRMLLYRKDPRSSAARHAARAESEMEPLEVPDLNEAALSSLTELTAERIELIKRIMDGARW